VVGLTQSTGDVVSRWSAAADAGGI